MPRPLRPTLQHLPTWLDQAMLYEVYPQSFLDTNGDGIGDLPGVIAKLDHIRSLGCDGVWLNPCFVSPFGDAGYDVADFMRVDPRYGTNADLARLCREAHRRGMRVLLDLVAGHTSVEHPWFRAASGPTKTPYHDWFIFTDTPWADPGTPHRWVGGVGERCGQYLANFFYFQPALNFGWTDPDPAKPWQKPVDHAGPRAVRAEMKRIMRHWLDLGCDGFRVDMASSIVRNQRGVDTAGCQAFWREVHAMLARDYPDAALISEWSLPRDAIAGGFHIDFMIHFGTPAYTRLFRSEANANLTGEAGDSFFNRTGRGDITAFLDHYLDHYQATKGRGFIALPTGNHDIHRLSLNRDHDDLAVAYAFLLTMPGVPVVYYGDEIGLRHQDLPSKEGGYNRTGARCPMQWDGSRNAGFSSAPARDLYLPIDARRDRPTVAEQERDPDSLLHHVRRLAVLRRQNPVLGNTAGFKPLFAQRGRYPFVYERRLGRQRAVIAVNPADRSESARIRLPGAAKAVELASTRATLTPTRGGAEITLGSRGWGIWLF